MIGALAQGGDASLALVLARLDQAAAKLETLTATAESHTMSTRIALDLRRIAFGNRLTAALSLARFVTDRFYALGVGIVAREASLDQFIACWEGLEDPRTGNAALHDFHELLIIALCAVLSGGQGAVDMSEFAKKAYIDNGCFWRHELAPSHRFYRHANAGYLEFAVSIGFVPNAAPIVRQIYSEPQAAMRQRRW